MKKTQWFLLLALAMGMHVPETLPARAGERRAFDEIRERFEKASSQAKKTEHLGTLIANVKLHVEQALRHTPSEETRDLILSDLQVIECARARHQGHWTIRDALARFAVTDERIYSFEQALDHFRPHAEAPAAAAPVLQENAPIAQPSGIANPNVAMLSQNNGWWPWLVKKSWWLAPIVAAIVAIVYRKNSSHHAYRRNDR